MVARVHHGLRNEGAGENEKGEQDAHRASPAEELRRRWTDPVMTRSAPGYFAE
jgi:hypothetical protein